MQIMCHPRSAAFLVAYGASLLAVVLPILLLELSVGQLTGRAPVQSFYNICPALKGKNGSAYGLAKLLSFIISCYHLILIFKRKKF